jgi:hypothetical protein
MTQLRFVTSFLMILVAFSAREAAAQAAPAPPDTTALAKASQNPVGDLVSLPLQFNFQTAGDLRDRTLFNLNIQPVIPFSVSSKVNVISRTIVPIDSIPGGDPTTSFSGVGDIQEQIYFTPKSTGAVVWAIGPVVSLPTATAYPARTGSWAAGPGLVLLAMPGPFVVGGLLNQLWTFADDDTDPKIDQFLVQPFVNYNFAKGWAVSFGPAISANWDAPSGQEWTVPVGLGISRTTVFNGRPMTIGFQYYYNVVRPDGSAATLIRFSMSLLYPGRKDR